MPNKTLKELRAAARTRGLRGYSKLSRAELKKLLSRPVEPATATPKKTGGKRRKKIPASAKTGVAKAPSLGTGKKRSRAQPAPQPEKNTAATDIPKWKWAVVHPAAPEEEQVESAKYATAPPGEPAARSESRQAPISGIEEDIDNLPPITEPLLCLLPQKPGVMHGYWVVPPGAAPSWQSLKLRFGRLNQDRLEILEEISLSRQHGHWYFAVEESADVGAVYLQLGYYETDGRFVNAIRRGVARIPNLYASEQTDRSWWVSEEQFRAMYRLAGGRISGPHLGWTASISSSGGAPSSEGSGGRGRS